MIVGRMTRYSNIAITIVPVSVIALLGVHLKLMANYDTRQTDMQIMNLL